eukprot:63692_1
MKTEDIVIISLFDLLAMIVVFFILKIEWKKRRYEKVTFTTKMLEVFSLTTLVASICKQFFYCVRWLNGFCHFAIHLAWMADITASISMGMYQLSRLWYCFSQSQVHSNKGYPNWIIKTMFTIGIFIFMNNIIAPWFAMRTPSVCGINKHYKYVSKYNGDLFHSVGVIWYMSGKIIYSLWDIATLLLYIIKVISFKKFKSEQIDVYNRIISIL